MLFCGTARYDYAFDKELIVIGALHAPKNDSSNITPDYSHKILDFKRRTSLNIQPENNSRTFKAVYFNVYGDTTCSTAPWNRMKKGPPKQLLSPMKQVSIAVESGREGRAVLHRFLEELCLCSQQ